MQFKLKCSDLRFWLGICNKLPPSIFSISPKVYIEVIPFRPLLPILWAKIM
jgi:hypothetical protein